VIHATALLLYITAFVLWLRVLLRGDAEQGTGVASWVAAVTGFTLLTLALGLGWAWTVHFRNSLESGDPKILWAVFTWGVILAAVVLRLGKKGAPTRGAAASVVGFVLIVAAYVVVRVAMGGTSFL
jgi:ABC-type transport system involved in cytochrome c biogenesis permease subunit